MGLRGVEVLSDVVVGGFAQRLPQSYLQGHESPHGHVEEDLPHVPQFIQVHVGQADECKGQEGFTAPPHGEVGKQVALWWRQREAAEAGCPHLCISVVLHGSASRLGEDKIAGLPPPFKLLLHLA